MSTTITYDLAPAESMGNQAKAALTSASELVIDSPDMLQIAGDELREIKGLQKQVEEKRTSIVGPLNAAVKAINDMFRAPAEFLMQAESKLKRVMVTYTTEQERLAEVARRAAEARAAEERRRLAVIAAEQARIAAEAEAKALEAQQIVEAAVAAGDEEAAAQAMQVVHQHADLAASAQAAAISAEVVTFTPSVMPAQKVAGISGRVTYSAQVDDLAALIKAVAAGQAPLECIAADIKFLGAQARAFKKQGQLYPGVMAVAERGISARAA